MKKLIALTAIAATLMFTACSDDDDENNSRSCDLLGLVPVTIDDNGDGTATISIEGEEPQTFDLEGTDFNTFADQLCNGEFDLDLDFE